MNQYQLVICVLFFSSGPCCRRCPPALFHPFLRTENVAKEAFQHPYFYLSHKTAQGLIRWTLTYSTTNMNAKNTISLDTGYELWPAPRPAKISALLDGSSPDWVKWIFPKHPKSVFLAFSHLHYYIPVRGSAHPSINDLWVTPAKVDDVFTTESLPLAADTWIRLGENFDPKSGYAAPNLADRARRSSSGTQNESELTFNLGYHPPRFLEATLSFTLEVKKQLPEKGAKWLFIRARAKRIEDGRMDTEVVILDEKFELIAISQHVSAIVDFPLNQGPKEADQPPKAKI